MLFEDDFSINGIPASSLGIVMQNNFRFDGAEPEVETIQIAGRNGALHRYTGSYLNVRGKVECYIAHDNVVQDMNTLGRFLKPMDGYLRLDIQSDPDYYRMARVVAMPEHNVLLEFMAPFEIEFDCMPQHFLVEGDNPVSLVDGDTIENPTQQVARPTITLTGENMTSFTLGSQTVNLNGTTGTVVIDSYNHRAYNVDGEVVVPSTLLRGMEFPTIPVGESGISLVGDNMTCSIVPHWFEV